jgi:hypothetical protein
MFHGTAGVASANSLIQLPNPISTSAGSFIRERRRRDEEEEDVEEWWISGISLPYIYI